MSELKKYKYPLFLILILCLFKFIIVPIFEWQDTLIAENKLLERKAKKVDGLLADESQLNTDLENSKVALSSIIKYFYPQQEQQEFRLEQQKKLEKELSKYDLKSTSVGWQNTFEVPDTPLVRFQLQYAFNGDSEKVIAYLLSQQNVSYWQEVETLNINVRRQQAGELGQMSVTARISFYMLNEEFVDG